MHSGTCDRRVFEVHAGLTGRPGRPLGFLAYATIGAVGWPDLRQPHRLPELVLVKPDIGQRVSAGWHEAA